VQWALSIQMPDATASLDTERIAISRPPSGLDYYADTAWADHLPALVETAMMEAFERSGRIGAVARDSDGARADTMLGTDLRDFACRYDAGEGAPLAVVRIGARMMDAKSRKITGSAVFAKEVRATANSVPAGVAALTEAFGGVLAELVPWVLDRGTPA
jgi:cholesterol transport system auxiliary component